MVSVNQVQELSTAALGYYKVVKENQKLYNMVQDLKGWYFSQTKMLAFYRIFSQLSKFVIRSRLKCLQVVFEFTAVSGLLSILNPEML